jgi:MtN3 and saliva related transmembrane protein
MIYSTGVTRLDNERSNMGVDAVGWISAAVLVMTLSRQVYTQWRTRSIAGVSKWLFIGQLTASIGFTTYSFLLGNWVFVFVNFFLILTALVGQCVYIRNRRVAKKEHAPVPDT